MTDKTFAQAFEENMTAMGLPVPKTIFGTVGTTLGTVGAMAGAIAKVGASATLAEIFLTVPIAAGGTAAAVAVAEIVAACGAVAASFYVGACIGSVLVAAYETLDLFEIYKIAAWLKEVENSIGEALDRFIEKAISRNPQLSTMKESIIFAKRLCC
jgi:hypothetical protein